MTRCMSIVHTVPEGARTALRAVHSIEQPVMAAA
jgi:hypothetical protein